MLKFRSALVERTRFGLRSDNRGPYGQPGRPKDNGQQQGGVAVSADRADAVASLNGDENKERLIVC